MILKNLSNLQQRFAVSTIGLLILFTVVHYSTLPLFRPLFALICAACIACGIWEYYQIAIAKGCIPLTRLGIIANFAYVLALFLVTQGTATLLLPQIVFGLILLSFSVYYLFKDHDPLVNLAVTIFALIYLTIPLSLMLSINYFFPNGEQDGRLWLLYLLAVTKMTDTGAYFLGKKFGTKKLAPHISPKKTIEGAIGGLLTSVLASLIFYWASVAYPHTFRLSLSLAESLFLGCAIGVIGQFGDLIESLLKRDGGVKDSNQLPGLGGMLDIVDSLVFTTPLVYFFLQIKGAGTL
jgi:phosphatidate cytidylyltransferase